MDIGSFGKYLWLMTHRLIWTLISIVRTTKIWRLFISSLLHILVTGKYFNHIYIQFYNNFCWPGDKSFQPVLDEWLKFATTTKPSGPRVFIGLPAGLHGAGQSMYYLPPSELDAMYEVSWNSVGFMEQNL